MLTLDVAAGTLLVIAIVRGHYSGRLARKQSPSEDSRLAVRLVFSKLPLTFDGHLSMGSQRTVAC